MKTLKKRLVKRSLAVVMTVVLAWLIAAPAFAADEETEGSFCKRALNKCIAEAIISGLLSWGATIVLFATFCLVGYDFCVKYVDESL
ncbi:MAG: hypothetical protein NTV82_17930 [Candidatus Aminicenantes bacterium]|nr:hypothetical protein [Candidatus Aminicenantes bacterium]